MCPKAEPQKASRECPGGHLSHTLGTLFCGTGPLHTLSDAPRDTLDPKTTSSGWSASIHVIVVNALACLSALHPCAELPKKTPGQGSGHTLLALRHRDAHAHHPPPPEFMEEGVAQKGGAFEVKTGTPSACKRISLGPPAQQKRKKGTYVWLFRIRSGREAGRVSAVNWGIFEGGGQNMFFGPKRPPRNSFFIRCYLSQKDCMHFLLFGE